MDSNLSKIKPKLRTQGNVTGNFGRPKVKAANNSAIGLTSTEHIHIVTQDDYLNRMYDAMNLTDDENLKAFCYQQIKDILVQRGLW